MRALARDNLRCSFVQISHFVRDDNESVRDDKASVRDDKASIRDDKASIRDDKASVRDDNASVVFTVIMRALARNNLR